MAFKIYTKTGDQGETSLFGGTRLPKSHLRIEAYGTIDELNAHLGMLKDLWYHPEYSSQMLQIQNQLFVLGSILATDPSKPIPLPPVQIQDIEQLETWIDAMDEQLPPLKNFILPGGDISISQAHICRTVCRRAERNAVALALTTPIDAIVIQYLNRLSDYFFTLSRFIGWSKNVQEIPWVPKNK